MQLHNFFDLIVNMFRAWASNPAADSTAISPREHRGYLATWLEKDLRFFSLLVLPKNWMARIGCSKLYDTIIHLLFFCWRVREMLPKSFSIIHAVKCFYETEPEIWDSLNCIGSSWMSCTAFKLKCFRDFFFGTNLSLCLN